MLEIIIIFIVVIAAFAGVVWYATRSTRQQKQNSVLEQAARVEPELDKENGFSAVLEQQMTQHISEFDVNSEPNISLSVQAKKDAEEQVESGMQQDEIHFKSNDDIDVNIEIAAEPEPEISLVNDWDMVIAFTVMAEEGHRFSGKDIKIALESEQFHHGEMQIFHRLTQQKNPLFSAANILDPGTFDLEDIHTLSTPGVLIFAKLPGPINGLSLFDELLETSRAVTKKLSGVLCDDSRQMLTDKSVEDMRSRILNLNFSMHSESQNSHVYTD